MLLGPCLWSCVVFSNIMDSKEIHITEYASLFDYKLANQLMTSVHSQTTYGQTTIQRWHQWNMADQFDVVKNHIRDRGLIWEGKNTRLDNNSWFWFISDIHSSVYIIYITFAVSPTKYTCSKDVAMDKRVASWLTLWNLISFVLLKYSD